jgi:hypothetical protein
MITTSKLFKKLIKFVFIIWIFFDLDSALSETIKEFLGAQFLS